ncbi:MAG: hypothetical protein J5881_02500 [Clostridia bacterium]|nr:hypothetical protein [Clostridia bacterium]
MNVTLPDNKLDRKTVMVYAIIILICIASIFAVVWIQFFDGKIVETVGTLKGKSDYDYNNLKAEFNDLLTNDIQNYDEKFNIKKESLTNDLVYTVCEDNESSGEDYSIQVKIPYINVKSSTVKKINNEIKSTFIDKVESIKNTKNKYSTYSVQYGAYVQDGILSVVIKAEIQEGTKAQRTVIKTFNYDLENNSEISFAKLLEKKQVDTEYAQERINKEAQIGAKRSEDYKAMGYEIYERNLEDKMYKTENIKEFYFHDGTIYIIFAYGNNNYTNEVDIAVI